MNLCPCGSGKLFAACCAPYIGGKPAPTAEALMRSRYSAYALGNLDYIQKTCAGPAARSFNRIEAELSLPGTEWLELRINGTERGDKDDDTGTVSFSFQCRQNGQHVLQHETSIFHRIDGIWFYYDRQDEPKPTRSNAHKAGRNDPCPCGSGKKYKKCCGV